MFVHVTDKAFQYAMSHPHAPDNPTPVYSATIAPNGTFNSQIFSGTTTSRATGTSMSGTIEGSVCSYAFSMGQS
jgi:hypothetical protein